MHKQAINHKQAIIGGGYLFTENACWYQSFILVLPMQSITIPAHVCYYGSLCFVCLMLNKWYILCYVSKLFLWYLLCLLLIWKSGLKFESICWTEKSVTNAFPRSTDIIHVLNEFPLIKDILRYHKIDCYALHMSTTRKNRFGKKSFEVFFTTIPQCSPL